LTLTHSPPPPSPLQYLRTRSIRAASLLGKPAPLIQPKANEDYAFAPAVLSHLSQPEGFFLLGSYLTITWIYNLLPASYYTFPTDPSLPVSLGKVFCALLSVDFVQVRRAKRSGKRRNEAKRSGKRRNEAKTGEEQATGEKRRAARLASEQRVCDG